MASPIPKFKPEQVAQALRDSGGYVFLAARILKCSYKTIERYCKKHKICAAVRLQKHGENLDTAEAKLQSAINKGEAWAICFFLKTKGKGRGYVERQELTGKDGRSIKHDVNVEISGITDDELDSQIEELERRKVAAIAQGGNPSRN